MRSDLIDIEAQFQFATDKAACIRETEGGPDIWLPLSQIEIEGDRKRGSVVTVTLSEKLATEKGLV